MGGWYFEYANEFYPDTDDTAEVLTSLSYVRFPAERGRPRAARGDRAGPPVAPGDAERRRRLGRLRQGCDNEVWTYIPFADHNAMIDPSCEDITGRALEALYNLGDRPDHPAMRRGRRIPPVEAGEDGTWYGRWGCNYIYGTWLALRGTRCTPGEDLSAPRYQAAARWLRATQNADGGWGELQHSYEDPSAKGVGPSTPSQTAWALMALFALRDTACRPRAPGRRLPAPHPAVRRFLAGRALDRDGVPEGLLPSVSSVCDILPALGVVALPPGRRCACGGRAVGRSGPPSPLRRRPRRSKWSANNAISGPHHDRHDSALR